MHTRHIEQVTSARLLRKMFQDKLSFDEHVTLMLKACSQHSYIMKLLRNQGLPQYLLDNVYQTYNLPNLIRFTC